LFVGVKDPLGVVVVFELFVLEVGEQIEDFVFRQKNNGVYFLDELRDK